MMAEDFFVLVDQSRVRFSFHTAMTTCYKLAQMKWALIAVLPFVVVVGSTLSQSPVSAKVPITI